MEVDGMKGGLGSLMALKRQKPHLKVLLSIGGGAASEQFAFVAASVTLRDNFGRSARDLIDASGLDGIDSKSMMSGFFYTKSSKSGILKAIAADKYLLS
jgi:GH18 family chitinase